MAWSRGARGGWGAALGVVACVACTDTNGLGGGETFGGVKDAGPDAAKDGSSGPSFDGGVDPGGDGGPATAAGCDATKPYSAPAIVPELDASADIARSAVLTADGLDAYFISYTTSFSLRHAHRTDASSAFGAPVTVNLVPPPMAALSLTAGGTRLYYWNDTTTTGNYVATRGSAADEVASPTQINANRDAFRFFATTNNDSAYFSNLTGDGAVESILLQAPLNNTGFTTLAAHEVKNIHAAGANDQIPVLNASETILYFASSERSLSLGGALDIWVSRRASKTSDFGTPTLVTELSSATDAENVSWVSDDDCEIFIDRASHIYRSTRPK